MSFKHNLDKILPLGLIATRAYMLAHGMNRHGVDNAVKSGKLKPICRGVYVREGLPLNWQGVMSSLHVLNENQPVYLGGLSALEQSGFNHYVNRNPSVHVYAPIKKPRWLDYINLDVDFVWRTTKRLWNEIDTKDCIQVKWREDVSGYWLASVERACLELLADVPNGLSFEHADALFQGLSTLSPNKLKTVLNQCRSIKAKRLFFWFAKRHDFAWGRHLNVADYDLGNGKRVIDKNGRLDKVLLITVPKDL